jgi:hypothetical protein
MQIVMVSDIVEGNGKTIRQNNMEKTHEIPLGALVEITSEDSIYEDDPTNGLRLFVVNHSRDCDGTPLYDLSFSLNAQKEYDDVENRKDELRQCGLYPFLHGQACGALKRHYSIESLKVIRLPKQD